MGGFPVYSLLKSWEQHSQNWYMYSRWGCRSHFKVAAESFPSWDTIRGGHSFRIMYLHTNRPMSLLQTYWPTCTHQLLLEFGMGALTIEYLRGIRCQVTSRELKIQQLKPSLQWHQSPHFHLSECHLARYPSKVFNFRFAENSTKLCNLLYRGDYFTRPVLMDRHTALPQFPKS